MKKIFTILTLLMLPFALTANKEAIKEVKADEDTNATITIGGNTFSRITTSNMNKIKDGAKVILATENPTNGFAFATNDLSNTSSYITRGYLKSKLVELQILYLMLVKLMIHLNYQLINQNYLLKTPLITQAFTMTKIISYLAIHLIIPNFL